MNSIGELGARLGYTVYVVVGSDQGGYEVMDFDLRCVDARLAVGKAFNAEDDWLPLYEIADWFATREEAEAECARRN